MVSFLYSGIVLKIQKGGSQTPSKHSLNMAPQSPCCSLLLQKFPGRYNLAFVLRYSGTKKRERSVVPAPLSGYPCFPPSQGAAENALLPAYCSHSQTARESLGATVPTEEKEPSALEMKCLFYVAWMSLESLSFLKLLGTLSLHGGISKQTGATQLSFSSHHQFMENTKDRTNTNSDDRIPSHI